MSCGAILMIDFREVKLIQKNLKNLLAESNRRDAKLYSAMFSHMANDSSNAVKVSCMLH